MVLLYLSIAYWFQMNVSFIIFPYPKDLELQSKMFYKGI